MKILFSYRKGGIVRAIYRKNEPNQDVYFQRETEGEFYIAASDKTAINTQLKFPAVSKNLQVRWCSAKVKIEVLRSAIANNPDYLGEIFICTGERRQESDARAKYEEIELHQTNAKKRKAIAWRPIIDWTETEVWAIMEKYHVQPHPAYMLGWNRCSCQLCIFGDENVWATIQKISPEKIQAIGAIEQDINFTLYNNQTIEEKAQVGVPFEDIDAYWREQGNGTFTAPVVTTKWTLPKGAFKGHKAGAI